MLRPRHAIANQQLFSGPKNYHPELEVGSELSTVVHVEIPKRISLLQALLKV